MVFKSPTLAGPLLGGLLFLTTIFTVAGIHQGVVSGDFEKWFIRPLERISTQQSPTPSVDMVIPEYEPTIEPTVEPTSVPVKQYSPPVVANCTRFNIREGEFASNKCYSDADYDDLLHYIQRYNTAVFNYDSAVASMNITCNGSEFFKASCEKDQSRKSGAEIDMNNYRTTVQSIIGRGR